MQADNNQRPTIRPGLRFNAITDERLDYAKQLGVEEIIIHPYDLPYLPKDNLNLATARAWSFEELLQLRHRVEDAGLRLAAIENVPLSWYDEVIVGGEAAEAQLEQIKSTIRNIGRAGIDIFGYHWMGNGVWRTSLTRPGRGGAAATAFDHAEVTSQYDFEVVLDEDEMWDHFERFLDEVVPVAEDEGVTLALHPDDPPVSEIEGIPRLFTSFERYERGLNLPSSDHHQAELCVGTLAEMDEQRELVDFVSDLANDRRIAYVHFRNVDNTVPTFQETFIDDGRFNPVELLETLASTGFEGIVIPDHVPLMTGESKWRPRGRAYTVGFIRGVLSTHARRG